MSNQQGHHYFVSTALHWSVDADLFKALEKNRRAHGTRKTGGTVYVVYRVPAPVEQNYEIRNFEPQFNGTKFVESGKYE